MQETKRIQSEALERARKLARSTVDYLSSQSFQGEPLLHAVVCCDFVSHERLIESISHKILAAALLRARAEEATKLEQLTYNSHGIYFSSSVIKQRIREAAAELRAAADELEGK